MRTLLIIALTLFVNEQRVWCQSIREFYRLCNLVPLNSRFDAKTSKLQYEYDKYSYGNTYRLPCEQLKTLYNLPIRRILIQVVDNDTVDAIKIFLPFDSTLPKRMETELGPTEHVWMAFEPGKLDTVGVIWDRKWFVDDYILMMKCTRYIPLLGEEREDLFLLEIFPRPRKRLEGTDSSKVNH
jgi:hypothetical protein